MRFDATFWINPNVLFFVFFFTFTASSAESYLQCGPRWSTLTHIQKGGCECTGNSNSVWLILIHFLLLLWDCESTKYKMHGVCLHFPVFTKLYWWTVQKLMLLGFYTGGFLVYCIPHDDCFGCCLFQNLTGLYLQKFHLKAFLVT